jgi:hypothetical protein
VKSADVRKRLFEDCCFANQVVHLTRLAPRISRSPWPCRLQYLGKMAIRAELV